MDLAKTQPAESSKKQTLILASALATMSAKLDLEQLKSYWSMLYVARSDLRANPDQRLFQLPLKDLRTLAGLSGKDPQRLRKNIKEMIRAEVSFDFFNKDGDAEWSETGLVAGVDLRKVDGEWTLQYSFSHVIIDRILKPTIYATLGMESIAGIKRSKYAVILYGLCSDYLCPSNPRIAPPVMSVETLTSFLRLGDQYQLFADVKRSIIEPAIREINNETEITVDCDYIFEGNKTKAVKFSAKLKDTQKLIKTNEISKLGELMDLIPKDAHNSLKQVVADKLASDGFEYCLSNIKYALKTTNGENPAALIGLSLRGDYAKSTREKEAKDKIKKEKSEQEKAKKQAKEKEDKKAQERQAAKEKLALELYLSKPQPERDKIDEDLKGFAVGTKAVKLVMYFIEHGEIQ